MSVAGSNVSILKRPLTFTRLMVCNEHVDDNICVALERQYGGRCVAEGYIYPNSITVLSHSAFTVVERVHYQTTVTFSCRLFTLMVGSEWKCQILKVQANMAEGRLLQIEEELTSSSLSSVNTEIPFVRIILYCFPLQINGKSVDSSSVKPSDIVNIVIEECRPEETMDGIVAVAHIVM